ncbi:MAG: hypothetical protein LBJ24_00325 [Treponema sp.]|nr:hypothetical protein [Treponema sp.]
MEQINFLFLALVVVFLATCVTTHEPIVWDKTIPKEKTTTIYWVFYGGDVKPVVYNGVPVDWNIRSGYNVLKLPYGNITFELKGTTRGASYIYHYNGAGFSYTFEEGKEYTVYALNNFVKIHTGKSYSKDTLIETIIFD